MTTQPHPVGVRLLPWKLHPWIFDAVLVSIFLLGIIRRPFSEAGGFETVDIAALVVGLAVLFARRRYPLPGLAVSVAIALILVAISERPSMLLPVGLAILFTVGLQHDRRTAVIAGAITTVLFAVMTIVLIDQGEVEGSGLAAIAWPAFATAAGLAVRSSRENLAATQERAERAERSRDLEAQRRVVEERLRIARDVHDLVAHHIAVINVQSGVAGHLIEADPAAATQALGVVRESASTAVDQLGELLNVLRTPDDVHDPTSPTPDLEAIEDLVSSFAASGLQVQRKTSGARRPLSRSAELAAYRLVQEGLTNAHKYGDGAVSVEQHYDDDGLVISIHNNTVSDVPAGTGFGLLGMQERIEAVGGTLDASPSADGTVFRVSAVIPRKEES